MWPLLIVLSDPNIEIGLQLVDGTVHLFTKRDTVKFVEHGLVLPSAAPRSIPPKMPWAWAARGQVGRAVTTAIPSFFAEHRGKK
jgi:hypothetical protein